MMLLCLQRKIMISQKMKYWNCLLRQLNNARKKSCMYVENVVLVFEEFIITMQKMSTVR